MKHRHLLLLAFLPIAAEPATAQKPIPVPPARADLPRPVEKFSYGTYPSAISGTARFGYDAALGPTEWYQGDPADSLYRAAHAFFARQEYRRAADRFSEVRSKFPSSRYFCDAAYYEAFARYRLGRPDDLRTGYRVLEGMGARCSEATAETRSGGSSAVRVASGQRAFTVVRGRRPALDADVPELMLRINGALARAGDAEAAERVKRAASEGQNVCDREERNVKIEALSALAQMDAETAKPVLRDVLSMKDVCSAPVRRQAITMVTRWNDAAAVTLLGQVARTDPDPDTQLEAMRALGRMSNDAAFAALEEYLRSATDERIQREAAGVLARSDHPRAVTAVRALLERRDVAERIRISAINALASRDPGVEYWRSLYTKVESDELRRAIINAVARSNTDGARQFLLSIGRNPAEPSSVREAAVHRIRLNASIDELYKLLETADSRSMRLSIVNGLAARKEPEATDRLIDIAKTSTDPQVRQSAIRGLRQRTNDPKAVKALTEIITRSYLP